MTSTEGNILQNYLKALIMAEKAELDQLALNDPRKMSDEELKALATDAMAALGENHGTANSTDAGDRSALYNQQLLEDDEGEDAF